MPARLVLGYPHSLGRPPTRPPAGLLQADRLKVGGFRPGTWTIKTSVRTIDKVYWSKPIVRRSDEFSTTGSATRAKCDAVPLQDAPDDEIPRWFTGQNIPAELFGVGGPSIDLQRCSPRDVALWGQLASWEAISSEFMRRIYPAVPEIFSNNTPWIRVANRTHSPIRLEDRSRKPRNSNEAILEADRDDCLDYGASRVRGEAIPPVVKRIPEISTGPLHSFKLFADRMKAKVVGTHWDWLIGCTFRMAYFSSVV